MPNRSANLVARRYAVVLLILTLLFLLRVLGQALQSVAPVGWLPVFDDFQGSTISYPVLLAMQVLTLCLMLRATWRVFKDDCKGEQAAHPQRIRYLAWFGWVYMVGSVLRILIGLSVDNPPSWFASWISAILHVVLAAFVLTLVRYYRHGVITKP